MQNYGAAQSTRNAIKILLVSRVAVCTVSIEQWYRVKKPVGD